MIAEILPLYNACRLFLHNKYPGAQPLGVTELLRLVTGKAIVNCIFLDVLLIGKRTKLCKEQKFGTDYAIHELRPHLRQDETESYS